MLTFLHHAASYSSILMGLLVAFILYRSKKYRAKGVLDPWRPYLYTALIAVTIFAGWGFIVLTSHR
jgi:hypothetical protein